MQALDLIQDKYIEELEKLKPGTYQYNKRQSWLDDSDFKYSYWENFVQLKTQDYENKYFKRKMSNEELNEKLKELLI